jgi:hypothetical protein
VSTRLPELFTFLHSFQLEFFQFLPSEGKESVKVKKKKDVEKIKSSI